MAVTGATDGKDPAFGFGRSIPTMSIPTMSGANDEAAPITNQRATQSGHCSQHVVAQLKRDCVVLRYPLQTFVRFNP